VNDNNPSAGSGQGSSFSDIGHTALDVLGLVPVLGEPADLANAAWHAAEGNYLDAGLSLISVIPVVGDIAGKGGKLAKAVGGKLADKALDAIKALNIPEVLSKFRKDPQLGPHIDKIASALESWRQGLLNKFSDTPPGHPVGCAVTQAQKDAAAILEKAAGAEKRVTPDLTQLADSQGMKMEGLDFRLKSEESLTRKLADTPADQIGDALRYTMVSKPEALARNTATTLETLQSKGYEVLRVKDTFKPGAQYKGINTQVKSLDGQVFELQFHTPQSFDIKQNVTHTMYEEFRLLPASDPRKAQLANEMTQISSTISTPPGLDDALRNFPK